MRILVTRSGEQGRQLAERLAEAGFAAIHYAPVELGPISRTEALRRQLLQSLPVDILVAPSAEALRQMHALLGSSPLEQALVIVPGPGTASVAASLGCLKVRYPEREGSSERILELPELLNIAGKRVLITAAAGGRRLIEEVLRSRGATVQRLEVYERRSVPPGTEVLAGLRPDGGLITLLASGGALEALHRQLPADCWHQVAVHPVVAPSMRVAGQARAVGCADVHAADAADDRAMLAVLERLCPASH